MPSQKNNSKAFFRKCWRRFFSIETKIAANFVPAKKKMFVKSAGSILKWRKKNRPPFQGAKYQFPWVFQIKTSFNPNVSLVGGFDPFEKY